MVAVDRVQRLAAVRTIEITTTGRRSGRAIRVEIWWFHFEGRFIITGTPGRRDWLANVQARPRMTVHVLGEDLAAIGVPVDDPAYRERFFGQSGPEIEWYLAEAERAELVAHAPMIEVQLDEPA